VTQGVSSDEDALAASLAEPARFAVVFERHVDAIHRYLSFRVGPDIAEDLTAETFARAFAARRRYQVDRGSVKAWLFGIATNLAHHYWRTEGRRQKRDTATASGAIPEDHSEEATSNVFFSSQEGLIGQALCQLDDVQLDVLLLIAGPGFTYEEVSVALEIPVGTVRSRLSRARHQLRELLGDSRQYLEGEPPTEQAYIATESKQ